MPYLIGACLALAVAALGRWLGFEHERSFYATVLMVIASYYVLFAVMGGSTGALLREATVMGAFVVLAALGARRSRWLLVLGLAAHGVFDFFHAHVIQNAGVPSWWPQFCLAYDLVAAAYLSLILAPGRSRHQAP